MGGAQPYRSGHDHGDHEHGDGDERGHGDEHGHGDERGQRDRDGHGDEQGHLHVHAQGLAARLRHLVRPHSHDAAEHVDAAMETSSEGLRALWVSLAVLAATAAVQASAVGVAGSVALLGDTLHNAVDALTAVPLAVAFIGGRLPPNRRYTYGYGRAEALAGIVIVMLIAASSVLAATAAPTRLAPPRPVSNQ